MKFVLFLLAVLLAGCTAEGAKEKLERLGYTNVQVSGITYFAPSAWLCGKSLKYDFQGTNPKGQQVKGVVCYPNLLVGVATEEKMR